MTEPLVLRLGLHDYRVIPIRTDGTDRGICGCIDFEAGEIRLKPSLSPIDQCVTLIHELIHGALDMANRREQRLGEEDICGTLDQPLTMILRDNIELFSVLMQGIHRGQPVVVAAA